MVYPQRPDQSAIASLDPPFSILAGFSSAFHSGIRQGGAFELKQATWGYKHALLVRKPTGTTSSAGI